MSLDETEFIARKIVLKEQAVYLIKDEIRELRGLLLWLKFKVILKKLVVLGFCHELISQRIAQRLYNFFQLKID